MSKRARNIASRRLRRDLIELQKENILSISALPLDNNLFEWHVNIKPTDGVYSGVYFHLIMTFPDEYPSLPPKVKICTPICHPNIFNDWLCLSMLRAHTNNVPYEGWSGAYSVTSVLMQLQSFLFAEKIDQDEGYQANAQLTDHDVKQSIAICKSFKCKKCDHSHSTPWPTVKGPPEALIKVFPTDPKSGHVVVQGSACQTTHTYWVGAYGEFGSNYGKIMYEVFINWTGDKWARNNIRGGLCRFGFGSEYASVCGRDSESFGYGGTGMYSYNNKFDKFGLSFTKDDTITCAIDFDSQRIYFAKNGKIMDPQRALYIPDYLNGSLLYPILSFKNSRAEFNFAAPRKPVTWLIKKGFKTLEELAKEQGTMDGEADDGDGDMDDDNKTNIDWHSEYIVDDLWLSVFLSLSVQEIFSVQYVCKQWNKIIDKFNIIERNEIYCYFTKAKLGQSKGGRILGIGLNLKTNSYGGVEVNSQMDILSMNAWANGCRIGVWGEPLTHFLPLAMNRKHSEIARNQINKYLKILSKICYNNKQYKNMNQLEQYLDKYECLQLVDSLVTMMNQIVVQFVMKSTNNNATKVSMIACEKVVLGYCALHHLLLYLQSENRKIVTNYANKTAEKFIKLLHGSDKSNCRDLGKFLIYLMLSSKYQWKDVAEEFVKEVFTRNVRWMMNDHAKYNTTAVVRGRLQTTFNASKISRRLVMFQVWFMKNNALETLNGYNHRLGRPRQYVRFNIQRKTKFILNSKSWWDYFKELEISINNEKSMDQLLRFAVYRSSSKGYHKNYNTFARLPIKKLSAPTIRVLSKGYKLRDHLDEGDDDDDDDMKSALNDNQTRLNISRGRGWSSTPQSGWRGRGRGRANSGTRGRGRGSQSQPANVISNASRGRGRGRANSMNNNRFGGRGRGNVAPPQQQQNNNNRNFASNNRTYRSQRQQNQQQVTSGSNQNRSPNNHQNNQSRQQSGNYLSNRRSLFGDDAADNNHKRNTRRPSITNDDNDDDDNNNKGSLFERPSLFDANAKNNINDDNKSPSQQPGSQRQQNNNNNRNRRPQQLAPGSNQNVNVNGNQNEQPGEPQKKVQKLSKSQRRNRRRKSKNK